MVIEKNRIRVYFYASMISIVIVLLIVLNYMFINTYSSEVNAKIDEFVATNYDMEKDYIQDIVNSTIQSIEIETAKVHEDIEKEILRINTILNKQIINNMTIKDIYNDFQNIEFVQPFVEIVFYNKELETIQYAFQTDVELNKSILLSVFLEQYTEEAIVSTIDNELYNIVVRVKDSYIQDRIKENMTYRLKKERYKDDGYIWVNYILDYNGGDDYAIRLIHPNLPETEGMYLSTHMEDDHGNKLYLQELEGIIDDGELYYDYYFKKMNSEEIAHKLSYAKLYEPFDWVIATGVYLDDLDAYIGEETQKMNASVDAVSQRTLLISVISLIASGIVIVFFEKLIAQLIHTFQSDLNKMNADILAEKEEVEQFAYLDPLTDLLNRRGITTRIEEAFNKAKKHNEVFSIVIGDTDYFKLINDNHGHDAGDFVLKSITKIFKDNLRLEDAVSRWGGEEFLLLLNHADLESTTKKIEFLRKKIEDTQIHYSDQVLKCTLSFGIATYEPSVSSFEELIKTADTKLYEAKSAGRNQVKF